MPVAAPILCALLAAFQVTSATAGERFGAETRVRGINLAVKAFSGLEDEASAGTHRGIGYTYGETASDRANQYNGRVSDTGTSFIDYGARMYWPQIGRFISPDTAAPDLANPMSLNRYSYTFNNPYKYTDPDGHNPLLVTAGIGVGLGAIHGAYTSYLAEGEVNWRTVVDHASIGGMIGLTAGVAGPALAGGIEGAGAVAAGAGTSVAANRMQASQQMIANLQAQLARLQRVEGELRQQLQNGRERAAREIAAGNTPNPHGLGKEILPRMIQDTISASNAVAEQLSKLKKD